MKKTFFTSDTHFCHANIIKPTYDNRPFKNVDHMNESLIANWNEVVAQTDDVYFLGDFAFSFKSIDQVELIMARLYGNIFFIKGNHDKHDMIRLYKKYGTYLGMREEIYINGQLINIQHYPEEVWNKSHRGSWMFYAHCHHSLPDRLDMKRIDVGINGPDYNYYPQSFEYFEKVMSKKTFKAIDHHGS